MAKPYFESDHFIGGGSVAANIDEADCEQFRQIAEEELLALHEGNFARYQVRPSEFAAWQGVRNAAVHAPEK